MRSATLVSARTFEYDNRPAANAASSNGNPTSAVATRTYSLAAPTATEHDHDNQCAQDTTPHCAHPLRRSNSAISRSHSHVDAARRPASEQILASNRSSGTSSASSVRSLVTGLVTGSVDRRGGMPMARTTLPSIAIGGSGSGPNQFSGTACSWLRRTGALCHINVRSSISPTLPTCIPADLWTYVRG